MSILLVLLALAAFVLWSHIGSSRWSSRLAAPVTLVAMSLGVVSTLALTPVIPVGMGWVVFGELVLAVGAGIAVVARAPSLRRLPSRDPMALWLPASTGAVFWLATRVAAQFVPGASSVSWAMEGDATTNLNYVRRIIADNGILVGADGNPVPLPVSAIALPLSLDPASSSPDTALATQLAAYGWVWVCVFAVSSVVMGAVAASLIDPRKRALVAITSGLGSLLPLTWFVSGLPIDFGYFNMPFTIVLALTAWQLVLAAPRSPLVAVVGLVGVATLLLLTWTPIALVPVVFGVIVVVRERGILIGTRGRALAVAGAAVSVGVLWAATLTLPAYAEQGSALAASGQGYPSPWLFAIALVGLVLVAAALLRRRNPSPVFGLVVALVGSSYATAALFLLLSGSAFDPWTAYYPVKTGWLVCVILLPVALSLLAALASLAPFARRRETAAVAVAVVGGLVVALAAYAPVTPAAGFPRMQPAERILGGHVWNTGDDAVAVIDAVVAVSRDTDETPILWKTSSPDERMVNFWTIYTLDAREPGDTALRRFGFREYGPFRSGDARGPDSFNVLCSLMRDPDRTVVVYTSDDTVRADFAERCEGSRVDVRVDATPGIDL